MFSETADSSTTPTTSSSRMFESEREPLSPKNPQEGEEIIDKIFNNTKQNKIQETDFF
jgi:hypothetical protein